MEYKLNQEINYNSITTDLNVYGILVEAIKTWEAVIKIGKDTIINIKGIKPIVKISECKNQILLNPNLTEN